MGESRREGTASQFLTFAVAAEEYGIPILRCREIVELDVITKVPSAPPCVRGVINLRGSVVPVVDLAVRCGLPDIVPTPRTCIVIVDVAGDGDRTVLGLLVDAVNEAIDLDEGDIEPPPTFGTPVRVDYLEGMGKVGKKFVLLLDVDKMLSTSEILATTSVPAPAPALPDQDVSGLGDLSAAGSPAP